MDFKLSKTVFIGKKLYCTLFGHDIVTSRSITNHLKEYKCKTCQMELTNNEAGAITLLTPELREVNEALVSFCKKKLLTKQ
ncbi:hypothetical protein ACYE2N_03240 [Flavobacterium sp. MAHUQ-51]|uniref:hypothetical protein n=1 Tax=Flavobacterium sp. GCM10022190 TaxID=3252639 RepID=UPI00361F8F56